MTLFRTFEPGLPKVRVPKGGTSLLAHAPLRASPDDLVRMSFLLVPGFDVMSLSAAVGALQAANRAMQREVFRWRLESWEGQPVRSEEGWCLPVEGAARPAELTAAIWVCARTRANLSDVPEGLPDHLRALWRADRLIGGIGSAAFVLAEAGILSGHRLTLRWEDQPAFQAHWPELVAARDLYCIDRRIATCAGGIASADMMLQLVAAQCGLSIAQEAMHGCLLSSVRSGQVDQISPILSRVPGRNRSLLRAVEVIEQDYLEPDCLDRAEAAAGVSRRQLQRLFQSHLSKTPSGHIADLRVAHGRSLLEHTKMSVAEIALASGFEQTPAFSKMFRRRYGVRPSQFTHVHHGSRSAMQGR
ncbi:MAG: helix-turn-helix domain-containing protein [Alphaproteobacteria bacterium]|nr:helix-turn-helix domain-containing protein [Alphaproteobacteria bacterium]